jgi:heptosyltransferase-2
MKILVINSKIGVGDMVIYLPYIHAISKKNNVKVSLLVKDNSRASSLLLHDDHIKEIISLDRTKDNTGSHDGIKGFIKLANEIKKKKFNKIYIFNSSLRYYLIARFAGIKNIYQYPLFRKRDNIVFSAKIFTENELDIVVSTQPKLFVKKDEFDQAKIKFDPYYKHICLGISASGYTKRWDINHYIRLGEQLCKKFPCKFYLAGGKNDQHLADKILSSSIGQNSLSFINLKIHETMPIIKNCNLYIGNDTGWLHISSGLGLKCLALFMDSPVMAYGKYSKNISVIVPEGEKEETTTHDTLGKDKISFEKVFTKAVDLLN